MLRRALRLRQRLSRPRLPQPAPAVPPSLDDLALRAGSDRCHAGRARAATPKSSPVPVTGGRCSRTRIAGLLDSRRSLTHPPCSFAPFNYDAVRRLRAAHVLPPGAGRQARACWPTMCGTPGETFARCAALVQERAAPVVATRGNLRPLRRRRSISACRTSRSPNISAPENYQVGRVSAVQGRDCRSQDSEKLRGTASAGSRQRALFSVRGLTGEVRERRSCATVTAEASRSIDTGHENPSHKMGAQHRGRRRRRPSGKARDDPSIPGVLVIRLTQVTPTYSVRRRGGLSADAGRIRGALRDRGGLSSLLDAAALARGISLPRLPGREAWAVRAVLRGSARRADDRPR